MGRGIIMSKCLRLPYYDELDKNLYYDGKYCFFLKDYYSIKKQDGSTYIYKDYEDFIEKWFYGENRII